MMNRNRNSQRMESTHNESTLSTSLPPSQTSSITSTGTVVSLLAPTTSNATTSNSPNEEAAGDYIMETAFGSDDLLDHGPMGSSTRLLKVAHWNNANHDHNDRMAFGLVGGGISNRPESILYRSQMSPNTARRRASENRKRLSRTVALKVCAISTVFLLILLGALIIIGYLYIRAKTELQPHQSRLKQIERKNVETNRLLKEALLINAKQIVWNRNQFYCFDPGKVQALATDRMALKLRHALTNLSNIPQQSKLENYQKYALKAYNMCQGRNISAEFQWLTNYLRSSNIRVPFIEPMNKRMNPFKIAFYLYRDFGLNHAFIDIESAVPIFKAGIRRSVMQLTPDLPPEFRKHSPSPSNSADDRARTESDPHYDRYSAELVHLVSQMIDKGRSIEIEPEKLSRTAEKLSRYLRMLGQYLLRVQRKEKEQLTEPNKMSIGNLLRILPFSSPPSTANTFHRIRRQLRANGDNPGIPLYAMNILDIKKWIRLVNSSPRLAHIFLVGLLLRDIFPHLNDPIYDCTKIFLNDKSKLLAEATVRLLIDSHSDLIDSHQRSLLMLNAYKADLSAFFQTAGHLPIEIKHLIENKLRHLKIFIGYENLDQLSVSAVNETYSLFQFTSNLYVPSTLSHFHNLYSQTVTFQQALKGGQQDGGGLSTKLSLNTLPSYSYGSNELTLGLSGLFWPIYHPDFPPSINAARLIAISPIEKSIDQHGIRYDINGRYSHKMTASPVRHDNNKKNEQNDGINNDNKIDDSLPSFTPPLNFDDLNQRLHFRLEHFKRTAYYPLGISTAQIFTTKNDSRIIPMAIRSENLVHLAFNSAFCLK